MGSSKLNHSFIIETIVENEGIIIGGYMREWMARGEPSDEGWNDIDCKFKSIEGHKTALKKLREEFGERAPNIDIRQINEHFQSFWCNCWMFDGEIKLIEPALSKKTFDQQKEENMAKQAKSIVPLWLLNIRDPKRITNLINNGWSIYDTSGKLIYNNPISLNTPNPEA
jgi:hypothetical protein